METETQATRTNNLLAELVELRLDEALLPALDVRREVRRLALHVVPRRLEHVSLEDQQLEKVTVSLDLGGVAGLALESELPCDKLVYGSDQASTDDGGGSESER